MIDVKRIGHATFETPDLDRQIDYFTQVTGLVLAERQNGRAYLATKLGDLVVQLEKGDVSRCARIAFQVAPDTEFNDIRKGIEAEGVRCEARNDTSPGIPKVVAFEDPKGTAIEVYAEQTPIAGKQASVPGIGPLKLGHLAFVVDEPKPFAEFYSKVLGFRVSDWIADWFVLHALRPGPSHREFRARQDHQDASHRVRAEGPGAAAGGLRLPRRQEHPDHLGAGPARAGPQHLHLSPQPRRPDHRDLLRARQDARREARLFRSAAVAPRPSAEAEGVDRCRPTSGARRRRRTICGSANSAERSRAATGATSIKPHQGGTLWLYRNANSARAASRCPPKGSA